MRVGRAGEGGGGEEREEKEEEEVLYVGRALFRIFTGRYGPFMGF